MAHPTRLTGLFLGAGASVEVGMPLVGELTEELKQWLTPDELRKLNAPHHHEPLTHAHEHYPDAHHRHEHEEG